MKKLGVPKEVKSGETRVGLTPSGVRDIAVSAQVIVEHDAGILSGYSDEDYIKAGATISNQEGIWDCDYIVKVKEPVLSEVQFFDNQTVFGYFHFASPHNEAGKVAKENLVCKPYEDIVNPDGSRPCLAPMSMVAGRLAAYKGAELLMNNGLLLSSVPSVKKPKVTILGAGVSGQHALQILYGMQADITIVDISLTKLDYISQMFPGVKTLASTDSNIKQAVLESHLVVGAVLVPGKSAPILISKDTIDNMPNGSVIVDISIDEGGCTEVSKPTTHDNPTYMVGGTTMYCVANMPAKVPRTSTPALTQQTLPFIMREL